MNEGGLRAPAAGVASVTGALIEHYPFSARGELSSRLLAVLTGDDAAAADLTDLAHRVLLDVTDVIRDDDVQLALFTLYCLAYGSLDQVGARWEWSPDLIRLRTTLEATFETALRERVTAPPLPPARSADVAAALFRLTTPSGGPSLARYVAKQASLDQLRELLVHRTIYTLREADPHSWAIPRLTGRAKAALVEIQADEYGGGDHDRMHADPQPLLR